MQTKKLNLSAMPGKLNRAEMKLLKGGDSSEGGDLCTGVVDCRRDQEPGDACFEGCVCSQQLKCVRTP